MEKKLTRTLLALMLVLIPSAVLGQTVSTTAKEERADSLLARIDTLIRLNARLMEKIDVLSEKDRYKLYETENIYTLLELDTQTGRLNQVQWSSDSDNEGTFTINDMDLRFQPISRSEYYCSGSFELYPTKNMYQFILLDRTTGRKWHVQWGTSGDKSRWIRRIY